MRGLAGRGALVTGGSRGIGMGVARRLLDEQCRVHLCADDSVDVAAAVRELSVSGEVTGSRCDVADPGAVAALVSEAEERLDGVDVLVSNAGISWRRAFLDITVAEWDRMQAVNLRGGFLVSQAVAKLMAGRRRGVIVTMASTNALAAEADYAHYNSSKGGLVQLTRSMAVELAAFGVRVNAVCPGYIDTPLNRSIVAELEDPDFAQNYVRCSIPLGRMGTVDDVASAVAFLASDEAAFVTGALLVVDGGQTAVM